MKSQKQNLIYITNNQLFSGIRTSIAKLKFNHKNFQDFKEGEIIYQPGNKSEYLYLITNGEVKMKQTGNHSRPVIKVKNEFFGEKELLSETLRTSSAVANTDCTIYKLKLKEVKNLISKNPLVKQNISKSLSYEIDDEGNTESKVDLDPLPIDLDKDTVKIKDIPAPKKKEENKNKEDDENSKEESEIILDEKEIDEMLKEDDERKEEKEVISGISENTLKKIIEELTIVNSQLNYEDTLNSIIDGYRKISGAESGILNVYVDENDTSKKKSYYGSDSHRIALEVIDDLAEETLVKKKTINLSKLANDQRFKIKTEDKNFTINSYISFPVISSDDEVNAIVQLFNSPNGRFQKIDEKLFSIFTYHSSKAIGEIWKKEEKIKKEKLETLKQIYNFLVPDIKYPVLAIRHYASLIKQREENEDIKSVLNMMILQANSISDIIESTFEFTQNKYSIKKELTGANELVENVLELLSEYVESRNVKLFKKLDGDATIQVDKKEFYQACFQIAKNSCDAMPSGGSLFVTTARNGENIKLEFKDEGKGIAEDVKPKIFEPFYSYGKGNATGIGLAIAKKIIKEHEGTIDFESAENEGTKFTISLPIIS